MIAYVENSARTETWVRDTTGPTAVDWGRQQRTQGEGGSLLMRYIWKTGSYGA